MKKILILTLLFFSLGSQAQFNKNIVYAGLLQFGAGFADGTNQAYLFHNRGQFGKIKPNNEAWANKWAKDLDGNPIVGKEAFLFSSRGLVFLTDFHHFTRFMENRFNEATGIVYSASYINYIFRAKKKRALGVEPRKYKKGKRLRKKWYWYAADYGVIFLARSAGFYTSYNIVFK